MSLSKYIITAKLTWDEAVAYRISFTIWRIRSVLSLLTVYFLWYSLLPKGQVILGYSQHIMLTYIIVSYLISALIFSTRTGEIGEIINNGDLSMYLLKPFSYFGYWAAKEIGDKAMNVLFSIIEITLIFLILKPPFFIQENIIYLVIFLLSIIFALFLFFWINILLGLIGFWSQEVWAPRFIFYTLITFFAGVWFPLDILPKPLFSLIKLLPFTYVLYFPSKIYLGQLSFYEIINGFIIIGIWAILLTLITKYVWQKGLRSYGAYGR